MGHQNRRRTKRKLRILEQTCHHFWSWATCSGNRNHQIPLGGILWKNDWLLGKLLSVVGTPLCGLYERGADHQCRWGEFGLGIFSIFGRYPIDLLKMAFHFIWKLQVTDSVEVLGLNWSRWNFSFCYLCYALSLSAGATGLENPLVKSSQGFCLERKMRIGSRGERQKKCPVERRGSLMVVLNYNLKANHNMWYVGNGINKLC